ncbi:hypothetical protein [Thalassospira povalilytica]|uniref:hypothetical protein n=1 Tax=Thalassospira povalilytica TaxID=732237 RepID=UPI001D184CF5|nr:hypothetical protein [Thalassospira povalilytica]MCC4240400.1 hypothetical protein [Thalassospira povalilytica]
MNMEEKIARAICIANSDDPDHYDKVWGFTWTNYIDHAKAALSTISDATDGMIERGQVVYGQSLYVPLANKGHGERAKIVFQAMIESAEEGK